MASFQISQRISSLQIAIILILLFWTHRSHTRYPETFLYHALSRNHSTPTDLIYGIQEWILQPSDMSTNQLIECRDSAQNIWRDQCADQLQLLIATAQNYSGTSFHFTPSAHIFMMKLREDGKRRNSSETSSAFYMGWRRPMLDNHLQLVLDIFASAGNGNRYFGNWEISVKVSRAYFSISNQSVSLFGYKWASVDEGYTIDRVRVRWHPAGYTVTDIVIAK